jgi:DNA-binding winged helix-turn-helix (wHTH) protein/tetratricopeptide (TPR) repeat protein
VPLAHRRRARSNVVPFPHRGPAARVYNDDAVPAEVQPSRRRLERFKLGEWLVVPAEGRLLGGVESRRLEPRTMDLLVCLAERAPGVVSKNALIDAVWEGGFISEGTLTNAVAELRAALGDDARSPRFIETIPKRGYRLLVEPLAEGGKGAAEGVPAPPRRRRLRWAAAAACALLAGVAAVLLLRPSPAPLDPGRVLIVPPVNRSGDPGLDSLCALTADRLGTGLSSSGFAEALPVPASAVPPDIAAISAAARERGAGLALAGALYLHEGRVELQLQLVDAGEAALLYAVPSESVPREQLEPTLERAVERALGAVATHLFGHAHSRLLSRPPLFAAYREFLAGSELWAGDYPEAVRHLERAVALDPGFVSAQLRLAMGYRTLGRSAEADAIVHTLAQRREELTEFERLWVDAFAAWFAGRTEERLRLLQRIDVMVPGDPAVAHLIVGTALRLNRPQEALRAAQSLALERVPPWMAGVPIVANFCEGAAAAHHRTGSFAEELAVAREALARFPSQARLRAAELRALGALGDRAQLEPALATLEIAAIPEAERLGCLLAALAAARAHGHPALAAELAARALHDMGAGPAPESQPELLWNAALLLVHAGELERGQALLEALRTRDAAFDPPEVAAWLGAVAARRGDLGTAARVTAELAASDDARSAGSRSYARAAIAAALGHREEALELLREAQRRGWGDFELLHDRDRLLFEPLGDLPEYRAILEPPG